MARRDPCAPRYFGSDYAISLQNVPPLPGRWAFERAAIESGNGYAVIPLQRDEKSSI
jgi:hypothetical protein